MFADELMDYYMLGAFVAVWMVFLYITLAMFGKKTFYVVCSVAVLFLGLYFPSLWWIYQ